ncbi:M14 family metallopeptidase [Pseudoxanthomonas sangjuensis]|uniref:M14 family metallopeptidase n=1 Tax=Pseudoxanthomonas sangjuensis TaxID=1503750 RepID=UPI001391D1F9|nr:M14 family metallopeptidase [Pseudoxanthomonas sangjuensis]KAF1715774.1 peptidase M14 [Pseudoxanthomonas sangjuensis]
MRQTFGRLPALALCAALALPASAADLSTHAERSGFTETGRYDEVIALCDAFQQAYPQAVRCTDFGTTPQGRPMKALVASTSGALDAKTAHERGLPVLLAQGGIHAGEIDGKDAGFLLLRELLEGKTGAGVLDKVVLVFVPVFNVDGHENFRAWNRPNQRGPKEMGFRTTAQRYNLNRDYVKADSPEMQAMLDLVQRWDPLVTLDLHVTDGAKFRHDISITGEPTNSGDEALREAGRALKDGIVAKLATQGSLPLGFYPSFVVDDDPASGFVDDVSTPRFSHGYFQLRNRIGILVETHSWRTYPERVRATHDTVLDALELTAANAQHWLALAHAADARAARLGGRPVALDHKATDAVRTVDFLSYEYTRSPSEISGATMTRYDESKPQVWKLPLRDTIVPDTVVVAPKGGYFVPPEYAAMVARWLLQHGIDYRVLANSTSHVKVQAFVADKVEFAANSVEGHQRATVRGAWQDDTVGIAAGTLYVPIAQAKSRLLVNLLEPQAPDSMAAWGEFNNAFERKEYMEAYVAEEQARLMLARDPKLKAEFEKKLKDDPAFAKDPQARLEFFYRRHPAWDTGYNRYPVLRTDTVY